jgi:glycine/D-amino acid oxidase-like deaminating enzyme
MEGPQLTQRFPWIAPEGVAAAGFGRSGEGWFDPPSLASLFRDAAKARGVAVIHDRVTGIDVRGRVEAVRLASGARIACGALVNAAGPWAGELAAFKEYAERKHTAGKTITFLGVFTFDPRAKPPLLIAAVLVGAFAIFHGYAHGAELPPGADAVAYSVGFVVATGLLHLTGIAFGLVARWPAGRIAVRTAGGAIALAGLVFLTAAT